MPHEEEYRANGIDDDDDDLGLAPDLQPETGYGCLVIVDNLPVVGQDKYDKLVTVVKKVYSQIGSIRENGILMPKDESGKTRGFAFIEFSTPEDAKAAVEQTNGYKLDVKHVFKVNHYSDFEKFLKVPEEYVPPAVPEFQPRENLKSYLMDAKARDQFVIRYADETEIYWNDTTKLEVDYSRKNWTESYVAWSPLGTYLATFHRQGIALWGGPSWLKLMRLSHPNVKLIDFSPKETYLVTWNNQEGDSSKDAQAIVVWDVRSGKKMAGFSGIKDGTAPSWPVFKWSHDDKYLARLTQDGLAVYEAPSMRLLDGKVIKLDGLRDFSWSPTDNILAGWQPETINTPARVTLIDIPSKKEIRQKNLFNVTDIKLHWQNEGDFLCVKVDRHTKTKKSTFTNFEFFRLRDKDVPIEVLEMKEAMIAFAWEPKGIRFAIIHGEGPRGDVSFYSMENPRGGKLKLLKTLEKKAANHLFWSPQGTYVVLAGLKTLNGVLEFFNVDSMEPMSTDEHFMCTDVEWDPTGRYVCTFVSHWRHQMENGFLIWTFQGKQVHKLMRDRFYQLLWRPRPPSLLPPEKEKYIRKNLHEYSKKYATEDEQRRENIATDAAKERQQVSEAWSAWARKKAEEYAEEKEARKAIRDGMDSEDERDYEFEEKLEDEIIHFKEEVVLGD
mmetsp:Transcript_26880/g.43881  ORF Transcript_26880/g.43881 Transcript_26880/m.43881 type:complete len:667 (-) Transcript_26880:280-2280(-)